MWRSIPARSRSVFLVLGALSLARRAEASPDTLLVVRVDTTQRHALLHVPPAASAGNPLPLVIAFHGAQGTAQGFMNGTGFNDAADMRGVLVAYPDAPLGNWAEDCSCNNADRLGANDTGFVRALIDSIARIAPLDRKRIYAVGFSQGALFTMRLGCQFADRIAAVAGVAGAMSAPLSERCRPVRPIATLWVVGKNDSVFPMWGPGVGAAGCWASRRRFGSGSRSTDANRPPQGRHRVGRTASNDAVVAGVPMESRCRCMRHVRGDTLGE